MTRDEVLRLLAQLKGGRFGEASHLLATAVASGATVLGPREPMVAHSLAPAYQVRSRSLRAAGKRMPGFDQVTEMLVEAPEQLSCVVGIDGANIGGVLFLRDGVALGCFAYDDRPDSEERRPAANVVATESPLRDIMIEIVTSHVVGLPAIVVAGAIISADAAFSSRMADAHGRTGYSTATKMFDRIRVYEAEVEKARLGWATFKERIAEATSAPHELLERTLIEVRQALDALVQETAPA